MIRLTTKAGPVLVNPSAVALVRRPDAADMTRVRLVDGTEVLVEETPDEILRRAWGLS